MIPTNVTLDWIEDRLDTLHPTHVAAFVRLLTELRALFDDDLDAMLILATTSLSLGGDGWRDALLKESPLAARGNPTNTQSIAHVSNIPRETVRRKLGWLQKKGWVERDERGNWIPTRAAARDLTPGTQATIIYLKTILNATSRAKKSNKRSNVSAPE